MMGAQVLTDGWRLQATKGPVADNVAGKIIPAQVPGSVHVDLLAAGLIQDPYLDQEEATLSWMHRVDWSYDYRLVADPVAAGERADLVFDGLDTVATIRLDDLEVGRTFNQHRTYRFDARPALAAAEGAAVKLEVGFRSALEHAEAEQDRIGPRPTTRPHPHNMVRKMACSFGWDWGPDLQTAGIWRPVRVERWHTARLAGVRPLVELEGDSARVTVHVEIERSGLEAVESAISVMVRLGGIKARGEVDPGSTSTRVEVVVPDPQLWWPTGYGDQSLYDLDVTVGVGEQELDEWHRRIGLRTVTLDTSPDAHGSAFTFLINGRPVFVKGANWIPQDHLLTRITRDRLARQLDKALEAQLNLLRVWGGGIYESEDFYDLCDQRGIMVWQDFLLACAAYPEEEPHRSEFEAEAREHVTRLTAHPSLVLWNGGNENIWGHEDWGWKDRLGDLTWGAGYYFDLFPSILSELDPTRPYSNGSPSSPQQSPILHPNDPDHGTHHQWEVWNRIDYTHYRDAIPRFCSEFGFQGPPTWATLERAVRNPQGTPLSKNDPVWLLHQKAADGNGKLDRGLAPHLPVPEAFTDWHWATQLNQARAVTHAITHYRSWWPRTAGAIVWQLNDCWPVTSWAAVDSDERPKPLWWAMRRAFAPRLLSVQTREIHGTKREMLSVINDTDTPWPGTVHVRRETLDGARIAQTDLPVHAAARSVVLLELPGTFRTPDDPSKEVLVAELDAATTTHCWVPDVDLQLATEPFVATVEPVADGYRVHITARSLVKDLMLHIDRLDPNATVDAALITLPAGAATCIHVQTMRAGLEEALITPPVLRTANDLRRANLEPPVPRDALLPLARRPQRRSVANPDPSH